MRVRVYIVFFIGFGVVGGGGGGGDLASKGRRKYTDGDDA
jgi:hypothetical protein